MKIKINTDSLEGFHKDQVVEVKSDGKIPLDEFWRRRLKDAVIDSCCEVVKAAPKRIKTESTKVEREKN